MMNEGLNGDTIEDCPSVRSLGLWFTVDQSASLEYADIELPLL